MASLVQINKKLGSIYDPQTRLVQQRQKAIPTKYKGAKASLNQAKVNAFRDIAQSANASGMLFSGFKPAEEARYLGEKFLPGLTNLEAQQQEENFGLLETLNAINADRRKTGLGLYNQEVDREFAERARRDEMALKRASLAQERELSYAQIAARNADRAAAQKQDEGLRYTYARNKSGGYNVFDKNGSPANIDLWQYTQLNGGGVGDLVSLLSEGDPQDKQAAYQYYRDIEKGASPADAFKRLQRNRPTAFYKSGR